MSGRVEWHGTVIADEKLKGRVLALGEPINRAKAILQDALVWNEFEEGNARVFQFCGPPELRDEGDFVIIGSERTADGIELELGIPASLIPAHTPTRHLDALRLLIMAVPAIAEALNVPPPKLK
jgi:hypothetical protein